MRRLLAVSAVLVVAETAVAQGTGSGSSDVIAMLDGLVLPITCVALLAFCAWVASWLRPLVRVTIESRHREALQESIANAAGLLRQKLAGKTGPAADMVRAEAVEYVMRAAPDAVSYFELTRSAIQQKISAKLSFASLAPLPPTASAGPAKSGSAAKPAPTPAGLRTAAGGRK